MVDVLEVNEWARLAQICDGLGSPVGPTSLLHTPQPCPEDQLETPAQRYIAHGMHTIKLRGVLDGGEKMLDIVRYVSLPDVQAPANMQPPLDK